MLEMVKENKYKIEYKNISFYSKYQRVRLMSCILIMRSFHIILHLMNIDQWPSYIMPTLNKKVKYPSSFGSMDMYPPQKWKDQGSIPLENELLKSWIPVPEVGETWQLGPVDPTDLSSPWGRDINQVSLQVSRNKKWAQWTHSLR